MFSLFNIFKYINSIQIMDMVKQYLIQKKKSASNIDSLAERLETVINLNDMSSLDKILNEFDTLNI